MTFFCCRYKEAYQKLKDLKIEIEHLQHLLEQARLRLTRSFEQWYMNVYADSDSVPFTNTTNAVIESQPDIDGNDNNPLGLESKRERVPSLVSESGIKLEKTLSVMSGMSFNNGSVVAPSAENFTREGILNNNGIRHYNDINNTDSISSNTSLPESSLVNSVSKSEVTVVYIL